MRDGDVQRYLSPEEREEYEAILYEATHDEFGQRRRSAEVGPKFRELLADAEQAQRVWAPWIREAAEVAGLRNVALKWAKSKTIIRTRNGERFVDKAAAYSIRRIDSRGDAAWQPTFWQDMTTDELRQLVADARKLQDAEGDRIATALRFLRLCERTNTDRPRDGLDAIGMSLDAYLMSEEDVA